MANTPPKLIVTLPDGEVRKYALQVDSVRMGRADDNTVVIDDPSLSAHHAVLHQMGDRYEILDLGSTNGLEFQGERIISRLLEDGDELKIGAVSLQFIDPDHPPAIESEGDAVVGVEEEGEEAAAPPPPSPPPASDVAEVTLDATPAPVAVRKTATQPRGPVQLDSEGGGFVAGVVLFLFTLLAPVVGLHVRHFQETGGNLMILDFLEARSGEMVEENATDSEGLPPENEVEDESP